MRVIQSLLYLVVVAGLLVACGGGGSGSTGGSGMPRIITKLANVDTGGAFNVTLSNGRAYFSNYSTGEIESVAVTGGEIATHYGTFASFGQVVHLGNQIYALDTRTAGQLLALPDTSVDVTRLSQTQNAASSTLDVVTDGTYAYWSEYDGGALTSRVVRIPLIPTGASPISPNTGASTDILINTLNGFARIALDGGKLFVSEGGTGNIYKVDLAKGTVSTLATAIVTPAYPHTDTFPLAAAGGHLYAQANNTSIVEINETTGGLKTIATAAVNTYMYSNHIHSDGNAVYWNEMMGTTPNWVIRRYAPQSAQLTDVVSIAMGDMNYDWSIVNGQAWWFSGPLASAVTLQKAPVTGGAATTVATLSVGGGGIVGDSTDLYYFTADSHLVRMSQAGGTPTIVSNSHYSSNAIALTSSSVVWGGNAVNGIMTIPKTAQPVVPTQISQATFPSMQSYMTADASSLYWATENFNPTTSSLSSQLVSGGPTNDLGTSDGNITRIFPYLNSLYLIRQTNTGWTISVLPNAGGSETVLVDSTSVLGEIRDAQVANGVLYITARAVLGGTGGVFALDLTTFKLSTLASDVRYPNRLYVDSSNIYWSTNGSTGGVYRTSLAGGAIETIYVGNWCWDIAGDNNNIYWADGWAIYSTKK